MSNVTIVLAEDHEVVRQGLRALLEAEPGFVVVGEACEGVEAARIVERLRPAVLLTDMSMPGLGGAELIRKVGRAAPETRVVVLSMYGTEGHVLEALRAGASAYVLKSSGASELVRGIREAVAGRRYLSRPLSEQALADYVDREGEAAVATPYESLTEREREVLHLASQGLTSRAIGERLYISSRTVEAHRASLMRKLGVRNQTELLRYAIARGIVPAQ